MKAEYSTDNRQTDKLNTNAKLSRWRMSVMIVRELVEQDLIWEAFVHAHLAGISRATAVRLVYRFYLVNLHRFPVKHGLTPYKEDSVLYTQQFRTECSAFNLTFEERGTSITTVTGEKITNWDFYVSLKYVYWKNPKQVNVLTKYDVKSSTKRMFPKVNIYPPVIERRINNHFGYKLIPSTKRAGVLPYGLGNNSTVKRVVEVVLKANIKRVSVEVYSHLSDHKLN